MPINRRQLLRALPVITGAATITGCTDESEGGADRVDESASQWEKVRAQFELSRETIDMSALLIASHPRPVREAIDRYRRELDRNPTLYLEEQINPGETRTFAAAAEYLGVNPDEIALTDSTTMGLALVYHGFHLRPGEEFLITDQNYYSTDESIRLAAARTGATVRSVPLYERIENVSADELVEKLVTGIGPATRVVALTWVHSSTGLKLPIRRMADAMAEINRNRDASENALLCVDGVHGFGVEDVEMNDLGCDFFVAGCHKWLFGPRGTGIIWGNERAWSAVTPTIPTFIDNSVRRAWIAGEEPTGPTTGKRMSPGGFKPYEHQWALAEAFEFHQKTGKAAVARRTHELSRQLKEGLSSMPHVKLYTPLSEELSAGIVCFDVNGMTQREVVQRLREKDIVATTTPYAPSYARLTPSIRNTPEEIDRVLREIHALS